MRSSFGSGMGGGSGGGGGGMLRTVQRAVRAGVGGATPEPFSSSSNSTTVARGANSRKAKHFSKNSSAPPNPALTLSSSSSSSFSTNNNLNVPSAFSSFPVSATSGGWGSCSSPTCSEELEWECVDGNEDGRARVIYDDFVFGNVPSSDEVHHAVSALQQVFEPSAFAHLSKEKLIKHTGKGISEEDTSPVGSSFSSESDVDWVEPSIEIFNSKMLQPYGSNRVYDAFHLLQTEPSVQRMVISLSSDKAVWDAVLNNEVVKELRGSINQAKLAVEESSNEGSDDSNPFKDILSWVFVNAKDKFTQLVDTITKLVNQFFQPPNEEEKGGTSDPTEGKLKTSLFLTVVVLLLVVVTRAKSA